MINEDWVELESQMYDETQKHRWLIRIELFVEWPSQVYDKTQMMSGELGSAHDSGGQYPSAQKTGSGCMLKALVIPVVLIGIFLLIAGKQENSHFQLWV